MHLNADNSGEYLRTQLEELGFDERRKLAGFLRENKLHLADLSKKFHTLEMDNNDANLRCVDADKRADAHDDRMRDIYNILSNIYG